MNKLSVAFKSLFASCVRPTEAPGPRSEPSVAPPGPRDEQLAGLTVRRPPRLPPKDVPRRLTAAQFTAVEQVIGQTAAVLDELPDAAREQRLQPLIAPLRNAQLAQARTMANVAEEDHLTRRQKNLSYAQLMRGVATLLATAESSVPPAQRPALEALLLAGEHHNRWVHHVGGASQTLPPHEHVAAGSDGVYAGYDLDGLTTTRAALETATLAHESVHEAQHNRRSRDSSAHPFDTSRHDLALQLDLASRLPPIVRHENIEPPAEYTAYCLHPWETQAFLEEQPASDLLPRASSTLSMKPLRAEAGMAALPLLLAQAAEAVLEAIPAHTENNTPAGLRLNDPQVARRMESIVFHTAELYGIAYSRAHSPQRAARLAQTLEDLAGLPAPRSHAEGLAHLDEIARALQRAMDDVAQAGLARHLAPGTNAAQRAAVAKRFADAKDEPALELAQVLGRIGLRLGRTRVVTADAPSIARSFEAARQDSGFADAVAALQARRGTVPRPEAIRDAVMRLGAALMGVAPGQLPDALLPQVHLYAAPSLEFERVPGLNAPPPRLDGDAPSATSARESSHQRRKAEFDPHTWQFHVPEHLLLEEAAGRLPARLAGLAADFAYTVVALMHRSSVDAEAEQAAGWIPMAPVSHAGDVMDVLDALQADELRIDGSPFAAAGGLLRERMACFVDEHPESAAAILHAVVRATPMRDEHPRWHEGLRAELKAQARAGSEDARDAYESRTLLRWQQAPVALRRAVIGPRGAAGNDA
ncbi:hypothetical protein [Methylibium sp.]|uniref:hypothetical protein n=1 Tax=Methylibium sp. TaxID=2067992 RepID=UPI002DBD64B2|nr:hypothetical protein [Methylibium sp.]